MKYFTHGYVSAFLVLSQALVLDSLAAAPVAQKVVTYEAFGAVGDGKSDDFAAIWKAHNHANSHQLPVRAKDAATYYIGGGKKSVTVMTNTNFGKAKFIIDDRDVESRKSEVFKITSKHKSIRVKGIQALKKSAAAVPFKHDLPALLVISDSSVAHYIRRGGNANDGKAMKDVILVGSDGVIDKSTPLLWAFPKVTSVVAHPIDKEQLVITGGHFTTIANKAKAEYDYFSRGIQISRSNVLVKNLQHAIKGEGESGAPYGGFLKISSSANVRIEDCGLSSHKAYQTKRNGKVVTMGSYDINISSSIKVTFERCKQLNSIHDTSLWGIMGSNYCKYLSYKDCELSRFDAHSGVYHATIDGCVIGSKGITVTGFGKLRILNTQVHAKQLVTLRPDYGSFWNGDIEISNCKLLPRHQKFSSIAVINGRNTEDHDFGYPTHMPRSIVIDGLHIDDSKHGSKYRGAFVLGNLNPKYSPSAKPKFPYKPVESISLKNVTTASKRAVSGCDNKVLSKVIKVAR